MAAHVTPRGAALAAPPQAVRRSPRQISVLLVESCRYFSTTPSGVHHLRVQVVINYGLLLVWEVLRLLRCSLLCLELGTSKSSLALYQSCMSMWNVWIILEIAVMRILVNDSIWLLIMMAPYSVIFHFSWTWLISNVHILQQMVSWSYNVRILDILEPISSFWSVLSSLKAIYFSLGHWENDLWMGKFAQWN